MNQPAAHADDTASSVHGNFGIKTDSSSEREAAHICSELAALKKQYARQQQVRIAEAQWESVHHF